MAEQDRGGLGPPKEASGHKGHLCRPAVLETSNGCLFGKHIHLAEATTTVPLESTLYNVHIIHIS